MYRDIILVSVWDDKTMSYVNPVAYKNNVLNEYIPEKKKDKQDIREHVQELMPFLELSDNEVLNDGVFQLERVHDQNEQEIISAENYNNLIHSDKEPGGMESGKVQFRHKH